MVNQQLFNYIRQQLAASVSSEEIAKALVTSGWQVGDINEAFASIASSSIAQTPAQSIIQPTDSSGQKGMWTIMIVVLLLIGAGGAFAAYHYNLFTLPSMVATPPANTSGVSTTSISVNNVSSTTTSSATSTTSLSTKALIKSEIDEYGVDLYKLKQGETTINTKNTFSTIDTNMRVVYTRMGDKIKADASSSQLHVIDHYVIQATQIIDSYGVPTSAIDKFGTNLSQLKEGETIVETTLSVKTKVVYTRTGDNIERKVTTTNAIFGGTNTISTTIDLNAKDSLPARIKEMENGIATDCKNSITAECTTGRKILNYLKTNCLSLKTNEEVSICTTASIASSL